MTYGPRLMSLLLGTLIGWTGSLALADGPYRRLVNFEWEADEDAKSFELEIKQSEKKGRTYKFKVSKSLWNGRLTPGQYTLRLRSLDARGVPGEWSEDVPFPVGLETPQILSPKPRQQIVGRGRSTTEVSLQWKPVPGAQSYRLEIASADGEVKRNTEGKTATIKVELPVAKVYQWKVFAIGAEGIESDTAAQGEFSLQGTKLANPKIEIPENEFAREISWQPTPDASKYDVVIARLSPERKGWVSMKKVLDTDQTSIAIDQNWPGGSYTVMVKAKGDLRSPSDFAKVPFRLRSGDRSPAAEFSAEVRKSIDRINGWYGIASYLITQVDYQSSDYDPRLPVGAVYSAVGGTGRLGLGYFKEKKSWGFLGIVDLSGFLNESGQNLTYASTEMSAVYRYGIGDRIELRAQIGGYYKEQQFAQGEYLGPGNARINGYTKGAMVGVHTGGEVWYSFSPKLGAQANLHLYMPLSAVKTPNGQPLVPALSNQIGFLGSYRFNRRLTGLVGYALREDRMEYKAAPVDPAFEGRNNSAVIKGNYLNFFAEYAF